MRKMTLMATALILGLGCAKKEEAVTVYEAVPVASRSIIVAVRAAGTVLPDTVVEVKSKASGEILEMRVETGQQVQRGQLLVRVDQRVPRNQLNEATAQLEVIKTRLGTAESQLRRSEELFKTASITEQEYENAQLAVANAKAEVVRAEVAVENARIAMEDTDVLAPISGTIITKSVERGQVISSPTNDVGGGSVLLTMADLNLVQIRTLVDEVDIGKIQPDLRATVTVNAFPNQPFEGRVLKVEPQAETVQNVTMFPVVIRVENRNGLLKPGMNTDVQIHVGQRDNVLAVPNSALRTDRDVNSAAFVLGIADDELQEMLVAARAIRDSAAPQTTLASRGGATDSAAAKPADTKAGGGETIEFGGRTITLPAGVSAEQVRAITGKLSSGGQLTQEERAVMQQLRGAGGGFGGGGFGGGGGRGGGNFQGGGGLGGRGGGNFQGGGFGGGDFQGGGFPGGGRPRPQSNAFQFGGDYIVFVSRAGKPTPVYIRTGLTDLDYSEVVRGLTAEDSVLLLPSASLVQQQEEWRNRMANLSGGSGVPGMTKAPTGGGR